MTSRERFEAHVKSELGDIAVMDAGRYISPKIHNYWLTWQAAECDMLERAIAAAKNERLTDNTNEPTDLAYNTAISHVVYKLKELLNDQK